MAAMVSPEYAWLWLAALGVVLFFPVRQMIWVLSVRKEQRRIGELPGEDVRQTLKRRAGATSALLCLVFVATYGAVVFAGQP